MLFSIEAVAYEYLKHHGSKWATVTRDRIETNPTLDLLASEIMQPRSVRHRPALSDAELPEFMQKLNPYGGEPVVVAALKMLLLTATRSGELSDTVGNAKTLPEISSRSYCLIDL